jgi:DNA-binding response OmpR family regulator
MAQSIQGGIRILLTDVVLHGMSGRHLAEKMRERIPDIRVLYMSGYMDDAMARHGVLEPGVELINKPFAVKDLLDRLATLLRGAGSAREN